MSTQGTSHGRADQAAWAAELQAALDQQRRVNAALQTRAEELSTANTRLLLQAAYAKNTTVKDWVIAVLLGLLGLIFISRGWWGA